MTKVVNLLYYKYGRMNIEGLIQEAEQHAQLLERGNLDKVAKYRCRCVFTATYHKASTEELKILMQSLLKVLNYI